VEDGCAAYDVNNGGEGWLHGREEGILAILREDGMFNDKVKLQDIN
jgi:hypothetical protein